MLEWYPSISRHLKSSHLALYMQAKTLNSTEARDFIGWIGIEKLESKQQSRHLYQGLWRQDLPGFNFFLSLTVNYCIENENVRAFVYFTCLCAYSLFEYTTRYFDKKRQKLKPSISDIMGNQNDKRYRTDMGVISSGEASESHHVSRINTVFFASNQFKGWHICVCIFSLERIARLIKLIELA